MWPTNSCSQTSFRIKLLPRQCQTFPTAVPAAAMLKVLSNYTFTTGVKITTPFFVVVKKPLFFGSWELKTTYCEYLSFNVHRLTLFIKPRWSFRIKGAVGSCKQTQRRRAVGKEEKKKKKNLSIYLRRQLHLLCGFACFFPAPFSYICWWKSCTEVTHTQKCARKRQRKRQM